MEDKVEGWAAVEFERAELGDKRRTARLIQIASALGRRPRASLPESANGDEAVLKGMYRFFDNRCVEHKAILASHIGATLDRVQEVDTLLAVQDSTEVYWTHGAQGLGALRGDREGCIVHTTLALTPERVALGLLQQQVWTRLGPRHNGDHAGRPIEEKESQKWLTSLAAVCEAREACPSTHFVSVGDREADVYDLFVVSRPEGVDLLVRAMSDRLVAHPERKLWNFMAGKPVGARVTVAVGRREDRPARKAHLTVRFGLVTLRPPKNRAAQKLPAVSVGVVWAREESPPKGAEPIEWMLLTTLAIDSAPDALRCLEWYSCRWGIEVWHKVLKSGCQIEARELQTADRLVRCLAIYSVIAWYVLYATMLARHVPDQACTMLLDEDQWQALYCVTHKTSTPPSKPPTLRQAVRWIAKLGGFLGRKGDGEPGITALWQGLQRLFDMTLMYRALRPHPST